MRTIAKVILSILGILILSLVGVFARNYALSQGYLSFSCQEETSPKANEGQLRFVWEGTTAPVACEPVVVQIDKYPERECASSPCPNQLIAIFRGKTTKQGTVLLPAWAMHYKNVSLSNAFGAYHSIQFTRQPSIGDITTFPRDLAATDIIQGKKAIDVRRIVDVRPSRFTLRIGERVTLSNPDSSRTTQSIQLMRHTSSGQLLLDTGDASYPVTATSSIRLPFDITRSALTATQITDSGVTFQIQRDSSPSQTSSSIALSQEINRLNENCYFHLSEASLRTKIERFTKTDPDAFQIFPRLSPNEPCRALFYAVRVIDLPKNLCETFNISVQIGTSSLEKDSCSLLFRSSQSKQLPELLRHGHFDGD